MFKRMNNDPSMEIAPQEVTRRSPDDTVMLDCRRDDELAIASISGALHIPLHEIPQRVDEICEHAGDREVIVFCHHGKRSLRATRFLRDAGVKKTLSMAGGIERWSLEIDPEVPRY
jgi:rhodanese-related sulfurtransferase